MGNNSLHPVDGLFDRLPNVDSYPKGVLPTPERIGGTAFFPGGYGLWRDIKQPQILPPMPVGGVMLLGHNFDCDRGYRESLAAGQEDLNAPTWCQLIKLLTSHHISLQECFFTNFFLGVSDGCDPMGPFPGVSDADFVSRCRDFFLLQLLAQKPRAVFVLGLDVPPLLAPVSPDLSPWTGAQGFSHIDINSGAVKT